jgi:hypothetical protein
MSHSTQGLTSSHSGHPFTQGCEPEKQKAAIKIQSAYRGHVVRSALKELRKQEEAAQSVYQAHVPQLQLQTKLAAEVKAQQSKRVAQPVPKFSAYTAEVRFAGGKEDFPIRSEEDVETMVKKINNEIYQKHGSLFIDFEGWGISDRVRKERMECYQKTPSATHLQFSMPVNSNFLRVKAKPITTDDLGEGKTRHTFENGITEIFINEDGIYKGTRLFPDGKQEKGKFDQEGRFFSGYRVGVDQQIEYCHPESFVFCEGNSEETLLHICEVEGKLVVLEDNVESNVSIDEVLKKASIRPASKYANGESIGKVLLHKDFENYFDQFIEFSLGVDASGVPRLFEFSNAAILDVLEAGSKIKAIDPLKIIEPKSQRNIFLQVAYWGNAKLLNNLAKLFPKAFEASEQAVVAEFLLCGHHLLDGDKLLRQSHKTSNFYDFLESPKLDSYHNMWLQVAKNEEPDEKFKNEFAGLSLSQKRNLYDAAFTYNNPFIYEPADLPVRADQYSINLMWINKSSISSDQEFLFGNGSTPEQQKLDFQTKFITPVGEWAKANPGSSINIWVDGELATVGAVVRSAQALQKALKGTLHGDVQFRDVRSIPIVSDNAEVFLSRTPIYFRVDLLRAIAADYALQRKETKYFVYGDLDVTPLSGHQLFDKRTVSFLDDFGIVMAKGGHLGFENSFQILNGDNTQCMDSHRKVIINLSIEMALKGPNAIKEQQIYDTYPAMITHFLDADGRYGKLNLNKNLQKNFGLRVFRFDRFGVAAHINLPLGDGAIELRKIMPRKPVRVPRSHF